MIRRCEDLESVCNRSMPYVDPILCLVYNHLGKASSHHLSSCDYENWLRLRNLIGYFIVQLVYTQ
jgi:hypothetical protein